MRRQISSVGLIAFALAGCIQRSVTTTDAATATATATGPTATPRPALSPSPSPSPSPAPHVGVRAPSTAHPAAAGPVDALVATRVRAWLATTPGAGVFVDANLVAAPEHDTPHARCVRVSPRAAPQPERASRVICVIGEQVLAGEEGFQRYLRAHQFDVTLARPAAEVLLRLRDDMLGLWGRRYTHVEARTEGETLVIEVDAEVTQSASSRTARAHWRLVIRADGSASES